MKIKIVLVIMLSVFFGNVTKAQFSLKKVRDSFKKTDGVSLSQGDIAKGLKEALTVGISNGSAEASKTDGFFKNELIKILIPPEAQKVTETLRKLGLGKEIDKFTLSLNRAAEDAAKKAKPIFVKAITSMTITDAVGILRGKDDAATTYLQKTTNQNLYNMFFPVVDSTLNINKATQYYADLVNTYNKVPLVKKVDPDLKGYATQKTIDGLFVLISQEEKKIRTDPGARVNDLLKSVFGK